MPVHRRAVMAVHSPTVMPVHSRTVVPVHSRDGRGPTLLSRASRSRASRLVGQHTVTQSHSHT
eukprot:9424350-Pyramimonas_sp.AAC.1